MSKEKKYFYDINENDPSEIAKAFTEERVTSDLTKRITISNLYEESRVEVDNWAFNEHSEQERKATVNVFDLGKKGYNLVVWISPDDGEKGVYKEGRLNIEFPVFGKKEWAIYGRHLPLLCNRIESVELAKRLLENGGVSIEPITDAESTREQPIGFKIEETDKWIKECKELMPEFMDIWNFIEEGKDEENKIKMEKDVKIAMEKANGDNYLFEMLMAQMGNEINSEGGHGSSYGFGSDRGIVAVIDSDGRVSYQLGNTEGLTHCEDCNIFYSGNVCPACKRSN